MTNSFSKKRPSFEQFRDWFIGAVTGLSDKDLKDGALPWLEVGDEKKRLEILIVLGQRLEKEFGVSFVVDNRMVNLNCPVESIVIQLFHVFSTVSLVDHINSKVYGRRG
ncbi:MAG: hypothetical protein AB1815_05745 [Bacillota bacterium]|jgi:hypothetical protein